MNALVLDSSGQFSEHASALAEGGKNKVYFHTVWEDGEPDFEDYAEGLDFDHLTKVRNISPLIKEADLVASFDVATNDILNIIKTNHPKKSCFGAGLGERLEHDRWNLKQLIKKVGLPYQKAVKIKGIDALRKYLQEHKDVYVKIDIWKKNLESFHSKDYRSVEGELDHLAAELGVPFKNEMHFIVEEAIHTDQEWGFDLIFNGHDYLKPYLYGVELKKIGYGGTLSDELPKPLKEVAEKLKPELQRMDYRGMISMEVKIKDGKPYVLDVCSRGALPLTIGYGEWFSNWPEIVFKVGLKQPVKINCPHKYVAAFPLGSKDNKEEYIPVTVKEGHRKNIKFWRPCKLGNEYFSVKGSEFAVVILGWGKTIDEAFKMIEREAEFVEFPGMEKEFGSLKKIKEITAAGKSEGISF